MNEPIPSGKHPAAAEAAVRSHPNVSDVELVGSRADGRAHELSDWDYVVTTTDFESVARDLPGLLGQLGPLAKQWDRYAPHACYMLIFPGPTKVDFLFLDEPRDWSPAWTASAETLDAIDQHFWDWILWLEQKCRGGKSSVLEEGLGNMLELLLGPMGVESVPRSVKDAVSAYLRARERLERRFSITVSRRLEEEVLPVLHAAEAS